MYDCPPCPFFPPLVQAVLDDLQNHLVITGFESKELRDVSSVVRAQSKKSPEVMVTTAAILKRHGFEKESEVLSGRLSSMLCSCMCYISQWILFIAAYVCIWLHP